MRRCYPKLILTLSALMQRLIPYSLPASILAAAIILTGAVAAPASDQEPVPWSNSMPPLAVVDSWKGLSKAILNRWETSSRLQSGWNTLDFDASGWQKVTERETVTYPSVIVDSRGGEHEISEVLQHVFLPFWHSRAERGKWVYFRRVFDYTEPPAGLGCATYLSVNETYILYVNGRRADGGTRDAFRVVRDFDITQYLKFGKNVLAVAALNTDGNPYLQVRTDLHLAYPVRSGQPMRWLCSLKASPDWNKPEFIATGWIPAVRTEFASGFAREGSIDTAPIWYPGDQDKTRVVYFLLPIDITGMPNWGGLDIQADNGWECYVNGHLAGVDKRDWMPRPTPLHHLEISRFLHPGRNVIAVKAYNYGGPAALACVPRIKVSF